MKTPWGSTIFEIATFIFYLILWVLTLAISSKYLSRAGRQAWQDCFITLLIGTILIVQYYYLLNATFYYPPDTAKLGLFRVLRNDCILSRKGGKVSLLDEKTEATRNPCYCGTSSTCFDHGIPHVNIAWELCPIGGSSYCLNKEKQQVPPYLTGEFRSMSRRDCSDGRGTMCTKLMPCTPCAVADIKAFGAPRCAVCTATNTGDCHFVEGIGPYCWTNTKKSEVQPCTQCCTEPTC